MMIQLIVNQWVYWENLDKRLNGLVGYIVLLTGSFKVPIDRITVISITLHTIRNTADLQWDFIKTERCEKFKYVRYLSANGGYNNMAEVQFYSDGKLLQGKVIGTDGAIDDFPNSTKYAVFDSDPLTFFDALEADGAWAGLEFDKPYTIDAIRYIFRNDDNNIRVGDTYELLYHSNGQWL